jgi:hypothetical protein
MSTVNSEVKENTPSKVGYPSSEKAREWSEEFLSNPDKFPCRVAVICNPDKPTEECVLVLPDTHKPELQYSDYLKTHKVVKLQTAS